MQSRSQLSHCLPCAQRLFEAHFFVLRFVTFFEPVTGCVLNKKIFELAALFDRRLQPPGCCTTTRPASPSGLRYFAATFVPFNVLRRSRKGALPNDLTELPSAANCVSKVEPYQLGLEGSSVHRNPFRQDFVFLFSCRLLFPRPRAVSGPVASKGGGKYAVIA